MRPSTHEFDPGPVHFNFVLDKVSLCKVVLWVTWFSPDSLIAPVLQTHRNTTLIKGASGRNLGTFSQSDALSDIVEHWTEKYRHV